MGDIRIALDVLPDTFEEDFEVIQSPDGVSKAMFDDAYNLVFVSLVMETLERSEINDTFTRFYSAMKENGELFVLTHSVEWAVSNIMNRDASSQVAYHHLYGNPIRPHRTGFLLNWLRTSMRVAGFAIRQATNIEVRSTVFDKGVFSLYNYVVGHKTPGIEPVEVISRQE
jgi:hypothetical protein